MKKDIVITSFFVCTLAIFCVSCPDDYPESPYPEEDRLSSWDHINQIIKRPGNWQRLVVDKELFQLGESAFSHVLSYNRDISIYNGSYGTFPAIDGSTVLLPLAAEFAWQFLDLSDDNTKEFFQFSTTHNAYLRLIGTLPDNNTNSRLIYYSTQNKRAHHHYYEKQPDIILATSPSVGELSIAANRGIALTIEPICYDSFVFITHKDNPVDNLTVGQIIEIYSGLIRNWNEVGGANEEIIAFQRRSGSGSQTAMEEMVMTGVKMMSAPTGWYVEAMGQLVEFVAEFQNAPNSIGYTFKYYVDRLYINQNIKILKVNGIEPNDNNVRNNTYPFVAPYNGVIRSSDADNVGGKFLNWLLTEEGQRVIANSGYVPLMDISRN